MATRNRANILRSVLTRYCTLSAPVGGWKLLVVDNDSGDHTRDVLHAFEHRLPLTCLVEHRDGKNVSLNAALSHIDGDLVVFTDDDSFPRCDWLVRLREAADAHPDVGMFGGVVVPRWEAPPPPWLLDTAPLAIAYTVSDPRLAAGPIDAGHLFGPNLAIRAEFFQRGHRFSTSIGPTRSRWYPMGSETEFVLRLQERGVSAYWVTAAVVEHHVTSPQLRPRWLLARAIRAGRGRRRLITLLHHHETDGADPGAFRCVLRAARWVVKGTVALGLFNRRAVFRAWWSASCAAGYAAEALMEQTPSFIGRVRTDANGPLGVRWFVAVAAAMTKRSSTRSSTSAEMPRPIQATNRP